MTITNPIYRLRLLISDIGGVSGDNFIFTDSEIETFLDMRYANEALAAATALRTLATNSTLVSKRIKFLELETDGPSETKALLAAADAFEKQGNDEGDDEIIEWGVDTFSIRTLKGLTP